MQILKGLNPMQRQAATFEGGPLLILAGAGSGKTSVLTTRIAYLVSGRDIAPQSILAVTFTNKAAFEIKERLKRLLGDKALGLWLGTFHSVGLRILKKHGHLTGINKDLTIYDDDDQLRLVKNVMNELGIGEKAFSPKAILYCIDRAKNEGIFPEDYKKSCANDFFSERVSEVYSLYQKRLRQMNALDFGDLICEPLRLFSLYPDVLSFYRENFRHILVDEYQDTNRSQYLLMKELASYHRNICAVGDPDQSIYAWRGADIRNILEFEKDWKDAVVMRLEQNYRSTKRILQASNSVIEKNKTRYEKALWTEKKEGAPVIYRECKNEHDEARLILGRIKEARDEDPSHGYRDFSVFYRTNAQSRVFEEHFIREGMPYTIVGGIRFYERQEIKDSLSYLRVAINPGDTISLKRIINVPPRGIGAVTLEEVEKIARGEDITLYEGFREAIKRGIIKKQEQVEFFRILEDIKKESPPPPPHEIALKLLEDTGYLKMWEKEKTEESYQRIENIHELVSAIKDFESNSGENPSLSDFLEHVSLVSDVDAYDTSSDRVTLMTLHSAKGLEFPVVFIVGLEEGLFPHAMARERENDVEEERRLFYVGMTRAKERLFLSSARERTIFGELRYRSPSRFISEIEPGFLEIIGAEKPPEGKVEEKVLEEKVFYTMEDTQIEHPREYCWQVGMKVSHPSFGTGIIKATEGMGEKTKLTVCFPGAGTKKLLARYTYLIPVPF